MSQPSTSDTATLVSLLLDVLYDWLEAGTSYRVADLARSFEGYAREHGHQADEALTRDLLWRIIVAPPYGFELSVDSRDMQRLRIITWYRPSGEPEAGERREAWARRRSAERHSSAERSFFIQPAPAKTGQGAGQAPSGLTLLSLGRRGKGGNLAKV